MKKLWSILVLLTALGTVALAQGKIETKKYKIRDLQEKITKVVMTGNDLRDGALRQDIVERWKLSPFEFCTLQEFEALKKSADYYFLLTVTGQFGGESEPGIGRPVFPVPFSRLTEGTWAVIILF